MAALFTVILLNVAMPATAATVNVPPNTALAGLTAKPSVTLPVNKVTGLPTTSLACTTIAGVMLAPAIAVLGCTVKAS